MGQSGAPRTDVDPHSISGKYFFDKEENKITKFITVNNNFYNLNFLS